MDERAVNGAMCPYCPFSDTDDCFCGPLRIVPIRQKDAKEYIKNTHRHHKPPVGSVFQVAIRKGDYIRGVAMCGRPVSRALDNGLTIEVNRVATDGVPNGCSKLYGACARIARELGYKKIITYILGSESGTSLKASGWINEGPAGGGRWKYKDQIRNNDHPLEVKQRWSKDL